LLFALRRKIVKELGYDERSKPMVRRALKRKMHKKQNGICPLCNEALPERYSVLDRFKAVDGYVEANVRLICAECDAKVQNERGYA
jgi:ssDNA-binding Zn-finger/Zn-ribbon topoisomerase 1